MSCPFLLDDADVCLDFDDIVGFGPDFGFDGVESAVSSPIFSMHLMHASIDERARIAERVVTFVAPHTSHSPM